MLRPYIILIAVPFPCHPPLVLSLTLIVGNWFTNWMGTWVWSVLVTTMWLSLQGKQSWRGKAGTLFVHCLSWIGTGIFVYINMITCWFSALLFTLAVINQNNFPDLRNTIWWTHAILKHSANTKSFSNLMELGKPKENVPFWVKDSCKQWSQLQPQCLVF